MQNFVPEGNWQMAAIMGLSEEEVQEVCKKVGNGFVVPANYNCEGQIVISGEENAVLEAEKIAKEMGAKKVRVLKTSGPFHTDKLTKASELLKNELENISINKFNTKVIKNLDGTVYTELDNIKEILVKHIINPVMFSKTLKNTLDDGIDTFIEIGPGKTLSGFVKRMKTEKNIKILNINNVETLEQVLKYIKEGE